MLRRADTGEEAKPRAMITAGRCRGRHADGPAAIGERKHSGKGEADSDVEGGNECSGNYEGSEDLQMI